MNKIEILGTILGIVVVILFIFPVVDYKDCYDMYVNECNNCHNKNLTYELCSGMCYEQPYLESRGCVYGLDRNCTTIEHDYCVSNSFRWRFGVLQLWGEKEHHGWYGYD